MRTQFESALYDIEMADNRVWLNNLLISFCHDLQMGRLKQFELHYLDILIEDKIRELEK